MGIGDAIEYASAIKAISDGNIFEKVGVAFVEEYNFLFKNYFNLENNFSYIINKNDLEKFDTIFHLTFEIESFINQKYSRSDIYNEIINFFKIKDIKKTHIELNKNKKIKKISIFPLSNSPIRTMPIEVLTQLTELLVKQFKIEIFLNQNLEVSQLFYKKITNKNLTFIDPKNKQDLISAIQKIDYGVFMDSGPLHIAKMFNKKGVLLETSVSSKILLKNYKMIKGVENSFSSLYCKAPCGLTDIFNYNNKHGCFDSLKINSAQIKRDNYQNIMHRGVKNYYMKNFIKPVGCAYSLNVQNIYNAVMNDLSICEES
tara:strand:- start:56 stop:1000 length:945 start_codon:yes stop_codon:yes gene_type:complete